MADFSYTGEATINASADKLFAIISEPTQHLAMAGSDEIKKITVTPAGPVGVGSKMFADEAVIVGGDTMEIAAESETITCDAGKKFAFLVFPALPGWVGRMEWSFNLSPDGSGTKVSHQLTLTRETLLTRTLKVSATTARAWTRPL
jgi:hypothetical protein